MEQIAQLPRSDAKVVKYGVYNLKPGPPKVRMVWVIGLKAIGEVVRVVRSLKISDIPPDIFIILVQPVWRRQTFGMRFQIGRDKDALSLPIWIEFVPLPFGATLCTHLGASRMACEEGM